MELVEPEQSGGSVYPIRAVERVCDILDILQTAVEGVSLAAVAAGTDLPKSSAYRYLLALEARRYAERDPDTNLFRLGLAFRPQRTRQMELFIERATPVLEQLRDQLNETVNLGVLDGGQVVHVVVVECAQMMRLAARVGERSPLHATALGKVMACELPRDRVRAILASEGMERLTDRTLCTVDDYLAELDRVAKDGFAVDDLEAQVDGRCVAVPLKGLPVPCGVSVSAPANRLAPDAVPVVAKHLKRAAAALVKAYRPLPA